MDLAEFIRLSLEEDTGSGDHSSLGSVPGQANGKAFLLVKESGRIAGLALAEKIFHARDPDLEVVFQKKDGEAVSPGEIAFTVTGNIRSLLNCERLVLNCLQRMSGIATLTAQFVKAVEGTGARILDTRKTTPLFRFFEKEAVRLGGGFNHRMGLYDMVLLKDNHIDFAGGIRPCIEKTNAYLAANNLRLKIEIEVRSMEELQQVLQTGQVHRIMLDNFTVPDLKRAVALVAGKFETEASGNIHLDNARSYAAAGVNFLSVGSLTHSYRSLDLSLKAET